MAMTEKEAVELTNEELLEHFIVMPIGGDPRDKGRLSVELQRRLDLYAESLLVSSAAYEEVLRDALDAAYESVAEFRKLRSQLKATLREALDGCDVEPLRRLSEFKTKYMPPHRQVQATDGGSPMTESGVEPKQD